MFVSTSTDPRFELPLDMASLGGMSPVDYLARHVTLTTSRRQLYDKVAQQIDTGCYSR